VELEREVEFTISLQDYTNKQSLKKNRNLRVRIRVRIYPPGTKFKAKNKCKLISFSLRILLKPYIECLFCSRV